MPVARRQPCPHMRGEHICLVMSSMTAIGSSPHAWGTPGHGRTGAADVRFIPTCVGNTTSGYKARSSSSVHPHMRGEYAPSIKATCGVSGSSPHAWGILSGQGGLELVGRFIPTCVGNTRGRPGHPAPRAVHPHMRGEYGAAWPASCRGSGSSPHAWGIRLTNLVQYAGTRFIPTCVGNTIAE